MTTIYYSKDHILIFNGKIHNPCAEQNHFVAEGELYRRQKKNPIKKFTGTLIQNCEGICVSDKNLKPLKKTIVSNNELMLLK